MGNYLHCVNLGSEFLEKAILFWGMINLDCKCITMLSWCILFKGVGKEEILVALNLIVFFVLFLESYRKEGNQSDPSEVPFQIK